MIELFANSGDSDQKPRYAASGLGLHCLSVTRLGVSSVQLVKTAADTLVQVTKSLSIYCDRRLI